MADGNGLEASTRWGALKVNGPVALVIVSLLIVIFLLFAALFGWISTPVTQMLNILQDQTTMLKAQTKALEDHASDTKQLRTELISAIDYQNMLMRAICYRMSDSKEQAMQCEPGYRGFPAEDLKYYERQKRR